MTNQQAQAINDRFVFDIKTCHLYAPDGRFLRKVSCSRSKHWNPLLTEDGGERCRGCETCGGRVIDLDVCDVGSAVEMLRSQPQHVCIHATATSGRVVFLEDPDAIPPLPAEPSGVIEIHTVRSVEDINRAAGMGYWPDVRLVEYVDLVWRRMQVDQHTTTGEILVSGDFRLRLPKGPVTGVPARYDPAEVSDWAEVIPLIDYYPYFQKIPIAAYLIPPGLPDGASVIVLDPIEDHQGQVWSPGDTLRAMNVTGRVDGRRVVLDPIKLEFMGRRS